MKRNVLRDLHSSDFSLPQEEIQMLAYCPPFFPDYQFYDTIALTSIE
jgi:hypothetical protein